MSDIQEIAVAKIDVPAGRRKVSPSWVMALAEDIEAHRQRTPIEVVETAKGFRLISGAHRLAAQKQREAETILAIVRPADAFASDAEMKLAEIAENFMRRELSVLDRAMDVAAWREIYEAARGTVKRGGDRRSAKAKAAKSQVETLNDDALEALAGRFAESFTEAAQAALKLDRNAVFRALRIASITAPARELIALHPLADNQSQLLALAAETPERQSRIAALVVAGDAITVADAIALIDKAPVPTSQSAWEKMAERFGRMPKRDRENFFAFHREEFEHWLARQAV